MQPVGCFPMLNTAIWNVQGLNRRDHQVAVRDLVTEFKLHFIALLETKVMPSNVYGCKQVYYLDGGGLWIILVLVIVFGLLGMMSLSMLIFLILGLTDLAVSVDLHWLVGEDFDAVLDMSEAEISCISAQYMAAPSDGTLYFVTRKLKALKPVFRQQSRRKGDLPMNVKLASGFLEVAQKLLQVDRHNSLLLQLENCCRVCWAVIGQIGSLTSTIYALGLSIFSQRKKLVLLSALLLVMLKQLYLTLRKTKHQGHMAFPKVRTPHSVADFRPISCCNVIYKVITKIFCGRIREILDLLISPSQNAFVLGRLISDNVLLAQELFSGYNQCRLLPRCALKVDLRKAYDTVEWDFLFAILRMFGFHVVFIRWIEECVTSAHFSIFVNGGVHGFFAGARGLRQGDPMSPYLFVLVMEVLQMILQQFIEQDGQFLYHWRCQELKLFQLSFADDLLLLCKAYVRSVNLFPRGLDLFASLSGLHTNPQKSQLIISKAVSGLRDSLLETLGFQEGHLPVRKLTARIKGWEGVQLSFAGRVQLIKTVLVSLEVYWAMEFILPKGIIKEMIKRLRTFLWKGTSSSGYPKEAWEVVCRPIEEGGQGIKDIFALNRALMSKHLWAVIKQDRTSIWVDWIFQFRVGDGNSFSLWHDLWHPLGHLIIRFPRGPQLTNTGLPDKLSVVMEDGQLANDY
ncbi:UNVERIFIED_CONTAM: Retrovirus-related Pol polyprotein from type-2 retrotransposable element R2DM [Sesamum calycinum]|uniref:Retrovirus-related Pol polyprotein from type-2 retrotransposable element R2DM n=1 Tax=Sesamum calycinum TaxID=2727403 RepID=A0AAW2JID6_9LAMI